jgi:1,4-dihydroxy-2-naphthoyl-CoA hydrolase
MTGPSEPSGLLRLNTLGMPALVGGEVVPATEALDGVLGFRISHLTPDHAQGEFEVTDTVRQRLGFVHGGAYAACAEMMATEATLATVIADGMIALGLANHTSFLRPVSEGRVSAIAELRHRGRITWIWDVNFRDEHGRPCATSRVTVAVRHRREDDPKAANAAS